MEPDAQTQLRSRFDCQLRTLSTYQLTRPASNPARPRDKTQIGRICRKDVCTLLGLAEWRPQNRAVSDVSDRCAASCVGSGTIQGSRERVCELRKTGEAAYSSARPARESWWVPREKYHG